jgi:hypothetical protein
MSEEYLRIPEEIIRDSAEVCSDDENNSFARLLKHGEELRAIGLTPLYVLDPYHMDIVVVIEETYEKKLN